MKFAVPRGTSDILPDAVVLWEELEYKARKICKSYGYREIRTPVYEDTNLFKRSLGPTSDVVNKQLLELASGKGDEGYALRPEGTASIVRSYIEQDFDKKEPLSKFFYIGPIFQGLAISLIWGGVLSTILTLVVVPIVYYMAEKKSDKPSMTNLS